MDHSPDTITPLDGITEHLDVLIVGAGISGIDAAYHLRKNRPGTTFAMIERMDNFGGTWRKHTFPGIRSDSDLFTFGFKWKPWEGVPIATADEILKYLDEALDENDLRQYIRFGQVVEHASWSTEAQKWILTVRKNGSDEPVLMSCGFLWMCSGYYRHSEGYTPNWPGMDSFQGQIVHPQTWPDDLDYTGKNVVVIGSGATAATLIPAMAKDAGHVTMLQRSPTYFYPRPAVDEFAETLRSLDLPKDQVHNIMRLKFLQDGRNTMHRAKTEPDALAREFIEAARAYLGEDFDVEKHFTPAYQPWRQRLAVIPDGDLFVAIREGHASVVTDHIETFTPTGIHLKSGEDLEADIIVTATGFNMNMLGDVAIDIDGKPVDLSTSFTHRGIMFSGVPNLATVFGYLRTSWTMRANLVSEYVCRLMDRMDKHQATSVVPTLRPQDQNMETRPWITPDNFNAGYIARKLDILPKQGDQQPWVMTQDYFDDKDTLPVADLEDGTLVYQKPIIAKASVG